MHSGGMAEIRASSISEKGRLLWRSPSTPCLLTQPMVSGQTIFVGACDGKFYALEKHHGTVVWSHDAHADGASGGFLTAPLLRGDLVIAGTAGRCGTKGSGFVYAFDQKTGAVRWKVQATVASNVFAEIDVWDPKSPLVFSTGDGEWLSVDARSGKVNWRFRTTPSGANCESRTSVATDGVTVCFLAQDGTLHCLDAKSGRELWRQQRKSAPTTDVLMYKDVLYFGSADDRIYGLIPANGKLVVQLRTPYTPIGGIAEADKETSADFEFSFATNGNTGQGVLMSYSDEFDRVLWSRSSAEGWSSNQPEPWKGVLVAGNCRGDVVAYRISDGEPQWRTHVDGCIEGLAHDSGSLYIEVREGAIYTYHPLAQSRSVRKVKNSATE